MRMYRRDKLMEMKEKMSQKAEAGDESEQGPHDQGVGVGETSLLPF